MAVLTTLSPFYSLPRSIPTPLVRAKKFGFRCRSSSGGNEEYLVDAPESVGDGFSFSGGKYSDGPSRSDDWFAQGKMVKAYPVYGGKGKAKDPIFGLTLGAGSQSSTDLFRWFCVEAGNSLKPPVILVHGFPSQAYSYRKVLPLLSEHHHVIAFDWLGFGFSDKPQPRYGFDYTLDEYASALESLIDVLARDKFSIVVQGFFAPVVLKYASRHQEKLSDLILINPPLTEKHTKLPSSLALFSNFLLGEIFSQDPLRASDKALTSCGPYMMKEEDAMVYRRPYLTSGSSGFALNALSKVMKKDLKSAKGELDLEDWKRWPSGEKTVKAVAVAVHKELKSDGAVAFLASRSMARKDGGTVALGDTKVGYSKSAEWWLQFGARAPNLQKIAIRIISQCVSSSGCKRNWSTFSLIHTKIRNRLSYRRLEKIVYVHYNIRLRLRILREKNERESEVADPFDEAFISDDSDPMIEWWSSDQDMTLNELGDLPRPSQYISKLVATEVDNKPTQTS